MNLCKEHKNFMAELFRIDPSKRMGAGLGILTDAELNRLRATMPKLMAHQKKDYAELKRRREELRRRRYKIDDNEI